MGALASDGQKYGSSRLEHLKAIESVGALALDGRKCGSSRFRRSKVWELTALGLKPRELAL